jgi:hypothetical protein
MTATLEGKRVLLVGRDYFFYTREIVSELDTALGARTTFVPIEPPGFLYRLLKKLGVLAPAWLRRYHRAVIAQARRAPPDLVLFIQVHQLGELLDEYRAALPRVPFVLYYWDSLRTHDYRRYLDSFQRVCSFDRDDVRDLPRLEYLPLFFCERFRGLRGAPAPDRDLAFVGTAVSLRRYRELERLRARTRAAGVSLVDYLVVSPLLYAAALLRGRVLRRVHFRALGEEALLRFYGRARAVLDLPNNVQSGYTMRTFEALGAHRKLVTTQQGIMQEDFYTRDAVFVLGVQGELPAPGFFCAAAHFSPALEAYSLRSWIRRLLEPAL